MENTIVKETHARTATKTVVYRILSLVITAVITGLFGGSSEQMAQMAVAAFVLGTVSYYVNDRVWLLFTWNRNEQGVDSTLRSITKTVVYRIIVLIITTITAKIILGGPLEQAAGFAVAMLAANGLLYFVCEKASNYIKWGRIYQVD